jgi:hypothetical protein
MMMDILHEMRSLGDVQAFLTISKATRELIWHAHFHWAITPATREIKEDVWRKMGDFSLEGQVGLIDEMRMDHRLPKRGVADSYPEITVLKWPVFIGVKEGKVRIWSNAQYSEEVPDGCYVGVKSFHQRYPNLKELKTLCFHGS